MLEIVESYVRQKVLDPVTKALTFDDLTLIPMYSEKGPKEVETQTILTRENDEKSSVILNIPIASAAMDTVTEENLAIALALEGGIGILHKNLSVKEQASQVAAVKRWMSAMISDPICAKSDWTVGKAKGTMERRKISGLPVVNDQRILVGIVTRRDIVSCSDSDQLVSSVMTKEVIYASKGIDVKEAQEIMLEHRIEKLPVIEPLGSELKLAGMFTAVDIQKRAENPKAALDEEKRLLVGAAVGDRWLEQKERVKALVKAGVDVIAVDTAHGDTANMKDMLSNLNQRYPHLPIIAGNVTTSEATLHLIEWGADAVKVGQGPSAICTTRVIAGIGIPQMTAIMECVGVSGDTPIIADGGITHSGEITKAIGAGANAVMLGTLLAGTNEAPGELIFHQGKRFKIYRGMGSIGAMKEGSSDRYRQEGESDEKKMVAEGVEGRVSYRGPLADHVYQLIGGLRAGMGYCGCKDVNELKEKAYFRIISGAALRESHPHDIEITEQAPNYPG